MLMYIESARPPIVNSIIDRHFTVLERHSQGSSTGTTTSRPQPATTNQHAKISDEVTLNMNIIVGKLGGHGYG
jgi:hypothetical protein